MTHIAHSLAGKNTIMNQFALFGNRSQDKSTNFYLDFSFFLFLFLTNQLI